MLINNLIYINKGPNKIGCFNKVIEIPCLPTLGTEIFFSGTGWGFTVDKITYSESNSIFTLHYIVDIEKEMERKEQHISDLFIPDMLINKMGFTIEWIEEELEGNN